MKRRIPGLERLIWIFFRRRGLMRSIPGFWAHWSTYADYSCSFSEENILYDGAFLSHVSLGRFTYIAPRARAGHATIGNFCSIAPEVIIGGGKHPTNFLSTHPAFYSKTRSNGSVRTGSITFNTTDFDELPATKIGHDVWIGTRAIILDGTSVGNGAIIAANAVVTKNVDAYTVVAGIPARPLRKRFSDEVISRLESWSWWDLPISILYKISPFFNKVTWELDDLNQTILLAQEENTERYTPGLR
jgi:acetyltransferase-like isoleucine patch superfamily enzyme